MPPKDSADVFDVNTQLLVGAIFAESASKNYGGGENADEKVAIGSTFVNAAYYAKLKPAAGKKCYNDALGDGTILGAVATMAVAYQTPTWNKVMSGNSLKTAEALAKLTTDDAEHLKLSIAAAKLIGPLHVPKSIAAIGNKVPVAFNKATNSPPSKRMVKIGKLGPHTFYGFISGRECE